MCDILTITRIKSKGMKQRCEQRSKIEKSKKRITLNESKNVKNIDKQEFTENMKWSNKFEGVRDSFFLRTNL